LEGPGIDGRIILRWVYERLDGGTEWIDLAQDRDRSWGLVNMVINLRVQQNAGNFLSSLGHFSFSGRLCSMELVR
jgi:hypothetical protein